MSNRERRARAAHRADIERRRREGTERVEAQRRVEEDAWFEANDEKFVLLESGADDWAAAMGFTIVSSERRMCDGSCANVSIAGRGMPELQILAGEGDEAWHFNLYLYEHGEGDPYVYAFLSRDLGASSTAREKYCTGDVSPVYVTDEVSFGAALAHMEAKETYVHYYDHPW